MKEKLDRNQRLYNYYIEHRNKMTRADMARIWHITPQRFGALIRRILQKEGPGAC